jgi:phytoene dehydrogenase-like protein
MAEPYDAVVVGSGPNGLTAAALLAREGLRVRVVEAATSFGGGLRTEELTLPGFHHDVCSAVHTLGCLSPAFALLELDKHGLRWLHPEASVAHPLDGGDAALLHVSIETTAQGLEADARAYRDLMSPLARCPQTLLADLLGPLAWPRDPLGLLRFGLLGARSARALAERHFCGAPARALLAGCAAHSIQPLEHMLTAAFGLMFLMTGHVKAWPVAAGGSSSIAAALVRVCEAHGVEFAAHEHITALSQLPPARAYLLDVAPAQLDTIAGDQLPAGYRRQLRRYRMGPACFKLDWALDGPIPWSDPRCALAATVHVGGTFDEIAAAEASVWKGGHPSEPFVLVAQQSLLDPARAPEGQHTGYAYCHVPAGSTVDMSDAIERQLERFAPGFRDRVLARHKLSPAAFEALNPSHIGGAVTGGVADVRQLFTRPARRLDPYSTPNPALFICSQSTPPGGGVHGMCGLHAARSALRRRFGKAFTLPAPTRALPAGA